MAFLTEPHFYQCGRLRSLKTARNKNILLVCDKKKGRQRMMLPIAELWILTVSILRGRQQLAIPRRPRARSSSTTATARSILFPVVLSFSTSPPSSIGVDDRAASSLPGCAVDGRGGIAP